MNISPCSKISGLNVEGCATDCTIGDRAMTWGPEKKGLPASKYRLQLVGTTASYTARPIEEYAITLESHVKSVVKMYSVQAFSFAGLKKAQVLAHQQNIIET